MHGSDTLNAKIPYAFGQELAWLRNTAREVNYAVMIGAGPGVMAMALMEGNPQLNLLVIDINTTIYTQKHLEAEGIYGVGYYVADSADYGKDYAGPKLDFLIVDGDHSKEGVIRDVRAWFKHVRPGGLIFFHDYVNINGDTNNGVADALLELVENNILDAEDVDTPGISIVYRKRENGLAKA